MSGLATYPVWVRVGQGWSSPKPFLRLAAPYWAYISKGYFGRFLSLWNLWMSE